MLRNQFFDRLSLLLVFLILPVAYQDCSGGGFKVASQGINSSSSLGSAGACQSGGTQRRVWMLSRLEYDNTVAAVFGETSNQAQNNFPPENRTNGFSSNATNQVVNSSQLNLIISAAETIAANQSQNQVNQLGCTLNPTPSATSPDPCAIQYINNVGLQLYRRPLLDAEINDMYSAYMTGYQYPYTGISATTSGIQLVITAFLEAPQFLYRSELGDRNDTTSPVVTMTQYEIAAALSYMATSGPPDATLLAAAASGSLNSPANLQAQFNRLIATPQGHARMAQFILEWIGADNIAQLGTSTGTLTPQIASYMQTEIQDYIYNVLFNSTGTFKELMTANYTFVNSPLASFYGITPVDSSTSFYKVSAPTALKMGLLSQGSFLASASISGVPILHRGSTIRRKLYCQQLPSVASLGLPGFTPPPLATPGPGQTTRDVLLNTIQPGTACYACHQYFMPIGFGLDHFDPFGRFRITENGVPLDTSGFIAVSNFIDPSSGLILDPGHTTDINFADYSGLMQTLANSSDVNNCFAEKMMVFASGRSDVANNECGVADLQSQFNSSGSNILSGFNSFIQSASFTQRTR